jgi:hypothetical protein
MARLPDQQKARQRSSSMHDCACRARRRRARRGPAELRLGLVVCDRHWLAKIEARLRELRRFCHAKDWQPRVSSAVGRAFSQINVLQAVLAVDVLSDLAEPGVGD